MPTEGPGAERRDSIESGSDELSTIPAAESPSSSSPLAHDSPEIEVVTINEDGDDFTAQSPPLAIIDEDDLFVDPIHNFPFRTEGESLATTMKRLCYFVQYGMWALLQVHQAFADLHRSRG
jgi:ubiquitin carboxyl-terminal hydrolase 34